MVRFLLRLFRLALATVVVLGGVGLLLWWSGLINLDRVSGTSLLGATPHQRYAARLRLQQALAGLPGSERLLRATGVPLPSSIEIDRWFESASGSLLQATSLSPTFTVGGTLARGGDAAAWRFHARRGHRIVVSGFARGGEAFLDLFAVSGTDFLHVASATAGGVEIAYVAAVDGDLLLRLQGAIGVRADYRIDERSEPSVTFPVKGLTSRAVQSRFGVARDAGRRSHEGIDIFAPRGTAVVAATDGWIGNSLRNGLGGNVVWVWNPLSRIRTYYAHLDRHAVDPGDRVRAGDVVGYVGNTGNARGGPTHLHFGIYVAGSGSVDPLPFVCGASCDAK